MEKRELEDSIRQMAQAQCLQDSSAPCPAPVSMAQRRARKDGSQGGTVDDVDPRDTLSWGGSQGRPDYQSVLSHATTPSWRSRSFPINFLKSHPNPCSAVQSDVSTGSRHRASEGKALQTDACPSGCRMPALPDEARRKTPCSELLRLKEIAEDVCEANALLVESYLNVKRRSVSRQGSGPSSASATNSCSRGIERQSTKCSSARESGDCRAAPDRSLLSSAPPRPPRRPKRYEQELGTLLEALESCTE